MGRDGNRRLSPTSYVVLGTIGLRGPSTPYDLKRAVGHSIGYFWPFPHAQLYSEPKRLAAAGLLTVTREDGGRRRQVYHLTDAGLGALRAWLAEPTNEQMQVRDIAEMKLFFSELARPQDLRALAGQQVEQHRRRIADYEAMMERFGPRPELAPRLISLRLGLRIEYAALEFWTGFREETARADAATENGSSFLAECYVGNIPVPCPMCDDLRILSRHYDAICPGTERRRMNVPARPWRTALIGSIALGVTLGVAGVSFASTPSGSAPKGAAARQQASAAFLRTHGSNLLINKNAVSAAPATAAENEPTNNHTPDDGDLADQQAQYDYERTAPAGYVTGPALADAAQQAAGLPNTGGTWQQFTTQPYNAEPSDYTDPFWGNEGSGFSLVGGRTTALVAAPDGAWFAGTADGGVWRSKDQGKHWTAVFDNMPTLSIGALAVDPVTHALWVGTGEANESADSYAGTGVYESTNDGQSFQPVGDVKGVSPLTSRTTFRIAFDQSGNAYAATNNGLFRYANGAWTEVLDPAGATDYPPYDQQVTDVAVVPGTHGRDVIAAIGWHGPGNTAYNGFYESTNAGRSFSEVTPSGDVNASDIGRTTFAYSADGSKLYAIVQSVSAEAAGAESVLQGIYVASGSPASVAGPWKKIADEAALAASGSALAVGSGYGVGIQAWYNQDLAVDPANPDHVYAGLEEVFESTNAGGSWVTASPYWNYGLACGASCPNTTHPDQHAMMIAGGKIVIGNDGGVYSRPLSDTQQYGDWSDLNATLQSWQYYDARAGLLPGGSTGIVGGLQDNGTSVDAAGSTQMDEAAGGDGADVIVDPANANNWVGEYTDGIEYSTTDGGHSFYDYVSPTCAAQATVGIALRADCDPNARFVAPLVPDDRSTNVWVTGGEFVWVTKSGWNTSCTDSACSWTPVYDLGPGNAVTALTSAGGGKTIYAAWVGGGGNPGSAFARGIATNYGGTWHQVSMAGLPQRYIAGVTVDPSDPAHAYAVFNGYSRRFVPGGGAGHVFETWNGGNSWTDISGNLPDIASDALVLTGGKLALATDAGVFTAAEGRGARTSWAVLGHGLPNTSVNDLTPGPNGYVYAATHGRGVWRIRL